MNLLNTRKKTGSGAPGWRGDLGIVTIEGTEIFSLAYYRRFRICVLQDIYHDLFCQLANNSGFNVCACLRQYSTSGGCLWGEDTLCTRTPIVVTARVASRLEVSSPLMFVSRLLRQPTRTLHARLFASKSTSATPKAVPERTTAGESPPTGGEQNAHATVLSTQLRSQRRPQRAQAPGQPVPRTPSSSD